MVDVHLTEDAAWDSHMNSSIVPYDVVITPENPREEWVVGINFGIEQEVETSDWYNREHVVLIDSEQESRFNVPINERGTFEYYQFGQCTTSQSNHLISYIQTVQK